MRALFFEAHGSRKGRATAVVMALLTGLLPACTSLPGMDSPQSDDGKRLIAQGRLDEGLAALKAAVQANPRQPDAYNSYVTQRDAIVSAYLRDGDAQRSGGDPAGAEQRYRMAQRFDPASTLAQRGLDMVARDRRLQAQADAAQKALEGSDFASAERLARAVVAEDSTQRTARAVMKAVAEERVRQSAAQPRLKAALDKHISLELREAPLRTAFEMISRTGGINFVLDRDVKTDQKTTIFVRDTSLEDVIRILLLTNQLERKVLNDNSIVIYPNTQAKQRDYQELAMRSFYLANADVKQTAALLRAMIKTRDLFVDEKLNLIIMRDTPEAIRLAEQLIAMQDLGEPEVMLDVEVLEVASSLVQNFGLQYPDQIVGQLPGLNTGTDGSTSLVPLSSHGLRAYVANPAIILNLSKTDGTTNLLANPRIRVKNREKAKILIGEKVPVITTTSTANVGVSSSVNYIDTGLKLEVEPNIYLENDVAIKVSLEVSSILAQLNISGTISYRLGARNAETTLRLKDGETQILAGLINNEDRKTASKVPQLGDYPLLGKLFRSDNDSSNKTEVVLLITPHVVRNLARPDNAASQIPFGTEASPGVAPLRLTAANSSTFVMSGPAAMGLDAAPTAAQPAPAAVQASGGVMLATMPGKVTLGQDFVLNLGVSSIGDGLITTVEISYDPAVLALAGGADAGAGPGAGTPGKASVDVRAAIAAGMGSPLTPVRFKVIGKAAARTEIGFDVTGSNSGVAPPVARQLEIVAK